MGAWIKFKERNGGHDFKGRSFRLNFGENFGDIAVQHTKRR